jgi:hypothetical protein
MFPLIDGRHIDGRSAPATQRNSRAILRLYNTAMPDRKANVQPESVTRDFIPVAPERSKRESLLKRRLIGAAVIIGLILLGLAFPVVI